MTKRKLPLKPLEDLEDALESLKAMMGENTTCAVPFDVGNTEQAKQAHYIQSWVIPKLERVISYAKTGIHK